MSDDNKKPDKNFYSNIPYEDRVIEVDFSAEELNLFIKLLGFCGKVLDMASKQTAQDTNSAKIYSDNADVSFAFRKKLLEYAKLGLPPDTDKH